MYVTNCIYKEISGTENQSEKFVVPPSGGLSRSFQI